MTTSQRDSVATILFAALMLVYAAYLVFGGIPLVKDATAMAGLGLVLSFAGQRIAGRSDFEHQQAAYTAGLATLAVGAAALATGSGAVLAMFMACNVALWAAATYLRMRTHGSATGGRHHPAFR
jgi:X-X-X-Leu-X-X-Gly heptad repeat protein